MRNTIDDLNIQLTPDKRRTDRSMVCIRVKDLSRRTVEAIGISICPEPSSVGIWLCNGEESKSGHSKGELCSEKIEHGLSRPPFSRDEQHCGRSVVL